MTFFACGYARRAVEWGNPHWGEPGHNVHIHEGANFLDAEPESDQ